MNDAMKVAFRDGDNFTVIHHRTNFRYISDVISSSSLAISWLMNVEKLSQDPSVRNVRNLLDPIYRIAATAIVVGNVGVEKLDRNDLTSLTVEFDMPAGLLCIKVKLPRERGQTWYKILLLPEDGKMLGTRLEKMVVPEIEQARLDRAREDLKGL